MNPPKGHFRRYWPAKKKMGENKLALIDKALPILVEYEARGFAMTLRQVYYQMVARGLFEENIQKNYDALGDALSDGRMAGLISWTAIEDRVRFLRGQEVFDNPIGALRNAREKYLVDRWANQPMRPEVWIEKDALLGIIQPICDELCVNYFSCKGYGSQSELWRAGQRFARYIHKGQRPIVFHLGDHDPSGVDMTRDNCDRLQLFAGVPIQVVRIALNMDQIRKYNPPPNYVKPKDARTADYVEQFGMDTCWELDALGPDVLHDLIEQALLSVRDHKLWDESLKREATDKDELDQIIEANLPPD